MIDTSTMTPIAELASRVGGHENVLAEFARDAEHYLSSRSWCRSVLGGHLAQGWDNFLAIFHFTLLPSDPRADNEVWVIVGDLPPAYMDCFYCRNGAEALEAYCINLQVWVDRVRSGGETEDCMPVVARDGHTPIIPTHEHVEMLQSRLDFIREKVLPDYQRDLLSDN